ncbi:FkbM family methyltransferase [Magnetospirillum sp. SS-4]|uniref:FkbM family methyltransferase n=1 Tax=Magnetospirillum sp. SS-4 TaxID=2681465 RepID=UPI001381401C
MAKSPSFQDIIDNPIPQISIVDVGAMSEGQERYDKLLGSGLATVTGFEPNPEEFARLQGRPGPYRYLPVFLGNGEPATFNVTRYPGCSSLLLPNPEVIDLFSTIGATLAEDNFRVVRSEEVQTTRLDDIDDLEVDYIKLDVQGSELEVMRHGTGKLADTVVIECEVEFMPLYRDQPLFGDIQVFLRDQGFVLHKMIDCAGRPFRPFQPPNPFLPMSQLLWADAIFVRDFTRLDAYGDDALLKAAAVLDVVYGSYDLVTLLLGEFDRRRCTQIRARYLASLRQRNLLLHFLNIKDHC